MTTKETKAGERTVKAWVLLAPKRKDGKEGGIWTLLLSEAGAKRNIGYYGEDRVRPCTITYSLT